MKRTAEVAAITRSRRRTRATSPPQINAQSTTPPSDKSQSATLPRSSNLSLANSDHIPASEVVEISTARSRARIRSTTRL